MFPLLEAYKTTRTHCVFEHTKESGKSLTLFHCIDCNFIEINLQFKVCRVFLSPKQHTFQVLFTNLSSYTCSHSETLRNLQYINQIENRLD